MGAKWSENSARVYSVLCLTLNCNSEHTRDVHNLPCLPLSFNISANFTMSKRGCAAITEFPLSSRREHTGRIFGDRPGFGEGTMLCARNCSSFFV